MNSSSFYLTHNYYPSKAEGWVDGVYCPREEQIDNIEGMSLLQEKNYCIIQSRVWKEVEETGFGVYQYEDTTAINYILENANYSVIIKFSNPMEHSYKVTIKANNIIKIDNQEICHEDQETVFTACIVRGNLSLKILTECVSETLDEAVYENVYVKEISLKRLPMNKPGEKPVIYLASDSTVQSYDKSFYPQTGWGEVLIQYFQKNISVKYLNPRPTVYETEDIIIDNRAIGGRSSKSFLEEGRFDRILMDVRENDYVFVQFGHNDGTKARPNRYVSVSDFERYIRYYIDGIHQRKATCVLVTPVARRNYREETGKFVISFNNYRSIMLKLAKEKNTPILDLGKESSAYLNSIGPEESKKLFMWIKPGEFPDGNYAEGKQDNTHLQRRGAIEFAGILVRLIKEYDMDNRLDYLKRLL